MYRRSGYLCRGIGFMVGSFSFLILWLLVSCSSPPDPRPDPSDEINRAYFESGDIGATSTGSLISLPPDFTIAIIDTHGGPVSSILQESYPNVTFRTESTPWDSQLGEVFHDHGHWVAHCALSQLPFDVRLEVVFLRVFDSQGRAIGLQGTRWVDELVEIAPDVINYSVGAHDQDDPRVERELKRLARIQLEALSRALDAIEAKTGRAVRFFAAAGNEDTYYKTSPPTAELDEDVAYWQAMSEEPRVSVIGACSMNGTPAWFSGDGPAVDCMYPGTEVPSIGRDGQVRWWAGTSAATPIALSDYVAMGLWSGWEGYVGREAESPDYLEGEHHPKQGWGSMIGPLRRNATWTSLDLFQPRPAALMGVEIAPSRITEFIPIEIQVELEIGEWEVLIELFPDD